MVARRVDGLIIVPAGDDQSYLANELRAGLKAVFADRPPGLLRGDVVLSDNAGGAQAAVRASARRRPHADRVSRGPDVDPDRRRALPRVRDMRSTTLGSTSTSS